MGKLWFAGLMAGVVTIAANAHAAGLDLTRYRVGPAIVLPAPISEASAVTYDWHSSNLFVLGDEGDALVQVTRTGSLVNSMSLTGFNDTEGITYIGGGKLVVTEERLRDAHLLTYSAGGSASRTTLPSVDLGITIGNTGIEGISFDQASGRFITVKEVAPQEVKQWRLDFIAGTATSSDLFTPNLGVLDLADIQVLGTVGSLQGTAAAENLLILSQASSKLIEVTRAGAIVSSLDFSAYSLNAEGVTIDPSGTIYIVGESYRKPIGTMLPSLTVEASAMFILTPVPEPETYAMMLFGLALLGWWHRRGLRTRRISAA